MKLETVTLWRPINKEELALVESSDYKEWPPRLPEQPIFYPVLNEEYAIKIARDWNASFFGVGFVTKFEIDKKYLDKFEVHQVGGAEILEYWIPAEELEIFNQHIVGHIEIVATFNKNTKT